MKKKFAGAAFFAQYTLTMNNDNTSINPVADLYQNAFEYEKKISGKYAQMTGTYQAILRCLWLHKIPGVEIKDEVAFEKYLDSRVEEVEQRFKNV